MKRIGDAVWGIAILGISLLLLSPETNTIYIKMYSVHPYALGFLKFAVLAMLGELLAIRIAEKDWKMVKGFFPKMVVWGIIGIIITFMFKMFPIGIQGMIDHGMLFGAQGFVGKLLIGFYVSIVANFAFGPIFMAAHRISDTYIEMRTDGKNATVKKVVDAVDWPYFINVVVGKMIPLFWLPAHTLTFILPEDYRILFAAYLSIVLGVLLAVAKSKDGR